MDKNEELLAPLESDDAQVQQLQPLSIETITTTDTEAVSMSFCENLSCNELLRKLREQRNNDRGTDITVVTKGQRFKAHRSVLSASSPFFETILKNNRMEEGLTISIPFAEGFDIVLDYMYTGMLKVDWSNVESLLKLATHFSIIKLRCYCEEFLDKFISVPNCLKVRKYCDQYSLDRITDCCSNFIHENIGQVLAHETFINLSFKRLENFLTDPEIGCDNVPLGLLLCALTQWLNHDLSNRSIDYQKLLMIINWADYEPNEVLSYIDEEPMFRQNPLCFYFILNTLEINGIPTDTYSTKFEELKRLYEVDEQKDATVESVETTVAKNAVPLTETSSASRSSSESNRVYNPTAVDCKAEPPKKLRNRVRRTPLKYQEVLVAEVHRPGKRQVKRRFDSQDWITETHSRKKKTLTEVNAKRSNVNMIAEPSSSISRARPTATSVTTISLSKKPERTKHSKNNKRDLVASESPVLIMPDEQDESPTTTTADGFNSADSLSTKKCLEDNDMLETDAFDTDGESSFNEANEVRTEFSVRGKKHSASVAEWRRGVKCPNCCYVGHSAGRLEHHLSKVHQEDTTYDCKMCDFSCNWNREFYKHMKGHFVGPPYRCTQCDYTCDRIQFILSHQMRHTDEKPFYCDRCSFRSRTRGNLLVHFRVHTGEKPYECQYCDKKFAMKNTLDQHMATHREERPYLCDTCGFTTKYQSHLLSHKRIHTGNVFRCEHEGCNYFSPRKSQLAAHVRSHLSIRTHICPTCGRAFIERSHLIRHERIHLDEKPFKCDQCEYGSTRRDKLKEHISKHHEQEAPQKSIRASRSKRKTHDKLIALPHPLQINGQPVSINLTKDMVQLQPNVTQNLSFAIGDQLYESQIVLANGKHATGGQEIQIANISEQELANAPLIYEYANGELAIANGRILIQNALEYDDDSQTVLIEEKDLNDLAKQQEEAKREEGHDHTNSPKASNSTAAVSDDEADLQNKE